MEFGTIRTLEDFRAALQLLGFVMGGSNAERIFSFSPFLDSFSAHPRRFFPETCGESLSGYPRRTPALESGNKLSA